MAVQRSHPFDPNIELARFFKALALALAVFDGATIWMFYLAAEPHVRRIWPHILITWSRLVRGAFHDPLVGRDVVVGLTCSTLLTAVS